MASRLEIRKSKETVCCCCGENRLAEKLAQKMPMRAREIVRAKLKREINRMKRKREKNTND